MKKMMIRKILSNFQKNTTLQAVLPGKTLVNLTDIIVNLLKVSIPTKTLKVKGIFEFTLDHDLWKNASARAPHTIHTYY